MTGATTSPQDVNLGRPPWTNPQARMPGMSADAREAQQALARAGHDPDPADGMWGAQSMRAVRDYQRANNLTATRRADSATLAALCGSSPAAMPASPATVPPTR